MNELFYKDLHTMSKSQILHRMVKDWYPFESNKPNQNNGLEQAPSPSPLSEGMH